ncbi:hypothetical protein Afil01_58550 [Actinorhabdospora filicis]|uniref:Uncharacterized protein n=1 Tax=Actinorhabdospora filicis TaxID=1785913 RepID=A0A9W6SRJ8_9ACTN|nr:hypothetical protein [Actinorhabdospora filicis]GLZ81048.1 hypothetical protein Afil01_58550 [Actinorhabdospora filicis]
MTEDLRARLDREFEDCTPDIIIDSASLMDRGRRRKRSRYAVMGTAALALVMALAVAIGNLPGRDGHPNPTTSGSPVPKTQPDFPLPEDLDLSAPSHWISEPGSENAVATNPETVRLHEALLARLRDHGVHPNDDSTFGRSLGGLELDSTPFTTDMVARWNARLSEQVAYQGGVLDLRPGPYPTSGRPEVNGYFSFEAVSKGSFKRGPTSASDNGHGEVRSAAYLYTCDDYTSWVADGYIVGDWDNTCATTDLADGAQLVTIESRRTPPPNGTEARAGIDTAILYLPNGNAYMMSTRLRTLDDGALAPPRLSAAQLGEILRSLPEVIVY